MKNNSAQILRALRKYFEITQVNFASIIGVSQSALSKIEADTLELSALQWVIICSKFNIDPKSLFTGKIEYLEDAKVTVGDYSSVGNFKIPKHYSHLMGSTVRTAYPLIKYMREKLGEDKSTKFLESTGFDSDYFIIMSNPLNLLFMQDLVSYLTSQRALAPQHISKIIETAKFEEAHSSIMDELSHSQNLATATKKLLARVKNTYEQNTDYEFVGGKEYVIATDRDHVAEFKLSSDFNKFRQIYNLSHFEALNTFVSGGETNGHFFKSKTTSNGWTINLAS